MLVKCEREIGKWATFYKSIKKIPYTQRFLTLLGFTHSFNKPLLSAYYFPKCKIYILKIAFDYCVRKEMLKWLMVFMLDHTFTERIIPKFKKCKLCQEMFGSPSLSW